VSFRLYEHHDLTRSAAGEGDRARYDAPEASYAALVLRAGSEPRAIRLGSKEEIDAAVRRWKDEAARGASDGRRSPGESEARYREIAEDLRQRVWDPVATVLGAETERVFVVPDGSMNLVTLASLPVGEDRYLLETGPTVHYLSAERDLTRARFEEPGRGMLAVGGPDYDATASFAALAETTAGASDPAAARVGTRGAACSSLGSLRFAPLPAAAEETGEVAELWSRSLGEGAADEDRGVRMVGSEATEAAFKRAATGRRVLHVATHGFFLGGDCAGGGEDTRGFGIVEHARESWALEGEALGPLLLSGLAMAGANHRDAAGAGEEDGILTAEEIAGLDLSGVEWAVLSACDTGVGEIEAGEGVFGLRRAMQVAGVRTLIMSLWPVDDGATRQWMHALYDGRLARRLDSAAAVRHAGETVLGARRAAGDSTHPFYWAAFVGAGDWH
jgi:CHAT domain-containing protein